MSFFSNTRNDLKEERRDIQANLYAGTITPDQIREKSARVRQIDAELRKQEKR